jgi:hypothetical protein
VSPTLEGSCRLGDLAIITLSLACTHEINAKQRMLDLTLVNPTGYDKIQPNNKVDNVGLATFPDKGLTLVAKHEDGTEDVCTFHYSYLFVFDTDFAVSTGTPIG